MRCCGKLFTWWSLVCLVYRDMGKKETNKSVVPFIYLIYFSNRFCCWQLSYHMNVNPRKWGFYSWGWGKKGSIRHPDRFCLKLYMAICPFPTLLHETREIQSYRCHMKEGRFSAFIHPFNKYLLGDRYVIDIVLDAGDAIMEKAWPLPSGKFYASRKCKHFNII